MTKNSGHAHIATCQCMPGQLFVSASGVPSKRAHKKRGGDPYGKVPCPDLGAPEPAGRGHTPTHTLRVFDKLHGFGHGKISGHIWGDIVVTIVAARPWYRRHIPKGVPALAWKGAHPGAITFCRAQLLWLAPSSAALAGRHRLRDRTFARHQHQARIFTK